MQTEDIMDFLIRNKAPGLGPAVLADLFDRMIWILSDNGSEIDRVRRKWLEGDDLEKVQVALEMNEAFLYDSRCELEKGLARIADRWPELRTRCDEILEHWKSQYG